MNPLCSRWSEKRRRNTGYRRGKRKTRDMFSFGYLKMEDADQHKADQHKAWLVAAMQPRANRWGVARGGLVALLASLEEEWPHVFAVPAGMLGPEPRPWVPCDTSEREVLKAYKRALLILHPDRIASARRDLSVVVEAEAVLKVLSEAHAQPEGWLKGAAREPAADHLSPPADLEPSCSRCPSTGASVRESVFGSVAGGGTAPPQPSRQRARSADPFPGASGQGPAPDPFASDPFGGCAANTQCTSESVAAVDNLFGTAPLRSPAAGSTIDDLFGIFRVREPARGPSFGLSHGQFSGNPFSSAAPVAAASSGADGWCGAAAGVGGGGDNPFETSRGDLRPIQNPFDSASGSGVGTEEDPSLVFFSATPAGRTLHTTRTTPSTQAANPF